jgi:hypothetical protein
MSTRLSGHAEVQGANELTCSHLHRRADGTGRSRRRLKVRFARSELWRDLGFKLLAIAGMMVVIAAVVMVVEGLSDRNLFSELENLLIPTTPRVQGW